MYVMMNEIMNDPDPDQRDKEEVMKLDCQQMPLYVGKQHVAPISRYWSTIQHGMNEFKQAKLEEAHSGRKLLRNRKSKKRHQIEDSRLDYALKIYIYKD